MLSLMSLPGRSMIPCSTSMRSGACRTKTRRLSRASSPTYPRQAHTPGWEHWCGEAGWGWLWGCWRVYQMQHCRTPARPAGWMSRLPRGCLRKLRGPSVSGQLHYGSVWELKLMVQDEHGSWVDNHSLPISVALEMRSEPWLSLAPIKEISWAAWKLMLTPIVALGSGTLVTPCVGDLAMGNSLVRGLPTEAHPLSCLELGLLVTLMDIHTTPQNKRARVNLITNGTAISECMVAKSATQLVWNAGSIMWIAQCTMWMQNGNC